MSVPSGASTVTAKCWWSLRLDSRASRALALGELLESLPVALLSSPLPPPER